MSEVDTDGFETEWVNYGDVNPKDHGGRFVQFRPIVNEWKVIETIPAVDVIPDWPEETSQAVKKYRFGFDDVWVDGNPENGFTDEMSHILEALGDTHHFEAPGGQPFMDRIGYYVADLTNRRGHDDPVKMLWVNMARRESNEHFHDDFNLKRMEPEYRIIERKSSYGQILQTYGIDPRR